MSETYEPRRVFTVEQANATLPLVRAIVTDMATLARDVLERRERLSYLQERRDASRSSDYYTEELSQTEREIEADVARVQEYIEELQELGVEPKNAPEGLVDFPAMIEGRVVFLCWKLGEGEVQYWHEMDAGFRGRQPLFAASCSTTEDSTDSTDSQ